MPSFKGKIHQIRFRLCFCPRPRWGAYRGAKRRKEEKVKGNLVIKGGKDQEKKGRKGGKEKEEKERKKRGRNVEACRNFQLF